MRAFCRAKPGEYGLASARISARLIVVNPSYGMAEVGIIYQVSLAVAKDRKAFMSSYRIDATIPGGCPGQQKTGSASAQARCSVQLTLEMGVRAMIVSLRDLIEQT